VSLDVGLMFQLKHDVVATNTIFLLACLLGLQWQRADRWSLDWLLARAPTACAPTSSRL
jgi:hypothetical protein